MSEPRPRPIDAPRQPWANPLGGGWIETGPPLAPARMEISYPNPPAREGRPDVDPQLVEMARAMNGPSKPKWIDNVPQFVRMIASGLAAGRTLEEIAADLDIELRIARLLLYANRDEIARRVEMIRRSAPRPPRETP